MVKCRDILIILCGPIWLVLLLISNILIPTLCFIFGPIIFPLALQSDFDWDKDRVDRGIKGLPSYKQVSGKHNEQE